MSVLRRINLNTILSFFSLVGLRSTKFVSSIVFVNIAGSSVVGIYYVFISMYRILNRVSTLGLTKSTVKDVSEREITESESFGDTLVTVFNIRVVVLLILSTGLFVLREPVGEYVGLNGAWIYVVTALWFTAVYSTLRSVLLGKRRTGTAGIFDLIKGVSISVIQLTLILAGYLEWGLIAGFAAGLVVSVVPLLLFARPPLLSASVDVEIARSLVSFAKYSYLDYFMGPEHRWVDITILGFFVSSGAIGVYGVAYAVAQFGLVFSVALSRNILPEASHLSSIGDVETRQSVVEHSLSYSTLFAIPILAGSIVLGDRLLTDIYGLTSGGTSLVLLTGGTVFYGAYQQVHQLFFGLDDPQYALGLSVLATGVNVVVAVATVPFYGIAGAAVSTTFSSLSALVVGIYMVNTRTGMTVSLPYREWGLQAACSVGMMLAVYLVRSQFTSKSRFYSGALILIGGVVYMSLILCTDTRLRKYVQRFVSEVLSDT